VIAWCKVCKKIVCDNTSIVRAIPLFQNVTSSKLRSNVTIVQPENQHRYAPAVFGNVKYVGNAFLGMLNMGTEKPTNWTM